MSRAARLGDGWHPINIRTRWLEEEGMPRLEEIAREEGMPVPGYNPEYSCASPTSRSTKSGASLERGP